MNRPTEGNPLQNQYNTPMTSNTKKQKAKRVHGSVPFSIWAYALIFVVVDFLCIGLLQWSVSPTADANATTSPVSSFYAFIALMWRNANYVLLLNMGLFGLFYFALVMLTNRMWGTTLFVLVTTGIIGIIEHIKVTVRYETVLPSDLSFLNKNTGNIASFIPPNTFVIIGGAVAAFIALWILVRIIKKFDLRHGYIFRKMQFVKALACRIALAGTCVVLLITYTFTVGNVDSFMRKAANKFGDSPAMWDSVYDAQSNGVLASFMRMLHPKVMDKPADYSQKTMETLSQKYANLADNFNAKRANYLQNNTVIFVLSESFSDPTRVPNITLNNDPIPFIRELKKSTTSGLMLSSGYGGGTANMEFQTLTGLSMANFDPSLTSPYQQLVPSMSWAPSVNQIWGGPEHSEAFHPYNPAMYSREKNYKKFGFSKFYTLGPGDIIDHQDKIDDSPYVSDTSAYQSALEQLKRGKNPQFMNIITMQNHMPYNNWYRDNTFVATSSSAEHPIGPDEQNAINTYAKGANYTDKATQHFLKQLDELHKPVTVVFYGDHLPGIYATAGADANNSLALHLTDYFIWSNKATHDTAKASDDSAYTSPNFFMAQAAEHLQAKVSPWLAFLTQLHDHIAAIEPPVVNQIQGWSRIPSGQTIYLNNAGKPLNANDFSKETRQLLEDYKLIQYDITAGKHYLEHTGFMTIPKPE